MANSFLDLVAGLDTNSGLTAALPKKTFSAAAALLAAGDKMKVKASPAPVQIPNCTGIWNDLSQYVVASWGTEGAPITVPNGRFETVGAGGADIIADWTETVTGTSSVGSSTAIKETEARSASLTNATGNHAQIASASALLTIGQTYRITLRVQQNNTQASFYVGRTDSLGLVSLDPSFGIWRTVTHDFVADSTSLILRVGGPSAGAARTVYIDRIISLVPVTTSASVPVKTIDDCSVAWTAGLQGGSSTLDTAVYKKATQNSTFRITGGNAIGQLAYRAIGTQDFSAYQTVLFWARVSVAQAAGSSRMSLRLCSDVLGQVTVNTIPIPALTAANRWTLVTVDTGGNLGNAIQSVALYMDATASAGNIWLDNIIACKNTANALSLTSLIGKGTANETYYGIASISHITPTSCRIWLDNQTETLGNAGRGYSAQTSDLNEALPLWKREPITLTQAGLGLPVASGSGVLSATPSGNGPASMTQFEFGYSDLSLAAPDSETWIDGQNGLGGLFSVGSLRFIKASGIAGVRANSLFNGSGSTPRNNLLLGIAANNMVSGGIALGSVFSRNIISIDYCNNNNNAGLSSVGANGMNTFYAKQINSNLNNGMILGINDSFLGGYDGSRTLIANNTNQSVSFHSGSYARNFSARNSAIGASFILNNATIFNLPAFAEDFVHGDTNIIASTSNVDTHLFLKKFNGVEGDNRVYTNGFIGFQESGIWRGNMPNATSRPAGMPFDLRIRRIACVANRAVTIKAQMKKDNAGVGCELVALGGQLAGVPNDVVAGVVGTAGYETVTLTFTSTESGFIDIVWRSYTTVANTNSYYQSSTLQGAATEAEINSLFIADRGGIVGANAASGNFQIIGSSLIRAGRMM